MGLRQRQSGQLREEDSRFFDLILWYELGDGDRNFCLGIGSYVATLTSFQTLSLAAAFVRLFCHHHLST